MNGLRFFPACFSAWSALNVEIGATRKECCNRLEKKYRVLIGNSILDVWLPRKPFLPDSARTTSELTQPKRNRGVGNSLASIKRSAGGGCG
jgi:hypothetical protein